MKYRQTLALIGACLFSCAVIGAQPKTELRPEAAEAFEAYVRQVERELDGRLAGDSARFLSGLDDAEAKQALRSGQVEPNATQKSLNVRGGLIQDWTATMFVTGASGNDVLAMLTDYNRHKEIYSEVADGRLLSRRGSTMSSSLRLVKEKVFKVVLDTEHDVEIRTGSAGRSQLRSRSRRIQEIRDADTPNEQKLPVGEDSGFLWRMNAYWSIQEKDGGVYVQCRSVTLTRGIPFGLAWIVKPFTTSLPRESLISTLEATRQELKNRAD